MFQWKVLHKILYAKKVKKVTSTRCSFCKLHDETIMHIFHDCLIVKRIWNQLKSIVSNNLTFPISTPQSAIFRFEYLDTHGRVDSPESPETPEMTENFSKVTKHLTRLKHISINHIWEKILLQKNSKNKKSMRT